MRLISKKEVGHKTSLSRATIDRNIKKKKFPKPTFWGSRLMFVEDEVDGWILARITERDMPLNTPR